MSETENDDETTEGVQLVDSANGTDCPPRGKPSHDDEVELSNLYLRTPTKTPEVNTPMTTKQAIPKIGFSLQNVKSAEEPAECWIPPSAQIPKEEREESAESEESTESEHHETESFAGGFCDNTDELQESSSEGEYEQEKDDGPGFSLSSTEFSTASEQAEDQNSRGFEYGTAPPAFGNFGEERPGKLPDSMKRLRPVSMSDEGGTGWKRPH